ncbi:MAG: FMN-dependent NADH-azoreductase, partial [Rheinheimera aquimaris]
MKLLHLKVSPNSAGSASREVGHHLLRKLQQRYPALTETV